MSPDNDRKWLALVLLCAVQFMVVLDVSIVNVALPRSRARSTSPHDEPAVGRQRLHADLRRPAAAGRPHGRPARAPAHVHDRPGAVLARLAGRRASPRRTPLIAARALQGLGAAMISPAALAILTTTFREGAERNKALGIWGAIAGVGGAVGVLLGGILVDYARLGVDLLPQRADRPRRDRWAPRVLARAAVEAGSRSFDVAGAVTVTAGLTLLVYGWSRRPPTAGPRPQTSARWRRRRCCWRPSSSSNGGPRRRCCRSDLPASAR